MICTNCGGFDADPVACPFNEYLMLLGNHFDGFVVNLEIHSCELSRQFLNGFFGDGI